MTTTITSLYLLASLLWFKLLGKGSYTSTAKPRPCQCRGQFGIWICTSLVRTLVKIWSISATSLSWSKSVEPSLWLWASLYSESICRSTFKVTYAQRQWYKFGNCLISDNRSPPHSPFADLLFLKNFVDDGKWNLKFVYSQWATYLIQTVTRN